MKKRCLNHLKLLSLFVVLLLFFQACSLLERPSATKRNEKIEQKLQQEAQKEYNRAQKQHLDRQSEATKRMMKSMERKNKKWLRTKKR